MTLALAREDWNKFLTSGGFEVDLTLTPPDPYIPIQIKGIYAKHHNSISTEGIPINARLTRISFLESDLILAEYPVRNSSGEIAIVRHLVDFVDSTGTSKRYIIKETFPDETVGVITCILGDYGS
jgi:hypothetical protein